MGKLHLCRPQTLGGFNECFEEQGQTHEKALRTPNSTLFGEKCKVRPPATKGNKKRVELGDKLGDRKERRTQHLRHTCGEKMGDNGRQWDHQPD